MPISKSAKRALRNAENKASANRHRKEVLKAALKKASDETLSETFSAIDKAAKRHIIHENKAARLKSRLSQKFTAKPGNAKASEDKPAKAVKKAATKTVAKKAAPATNPPAGGKKPVAKKK